MHTQKHLLLYFGSCHEEVNDLCVYLWTNFPPTFFSSSFFSRLNSNAIKQIMKNNMNQYILSFRLRYKDRRANRQAGKQTDRKRSLQTDKLKRLEKHGLLHFDSIIFDNPSPPLLSSFFMFIFIFIFIFIIIFIFIFIFIIIIIFIITATRSSKPT